MITKKQTKLQKSYKKFYLSGKSKRNLLDFLKFSMPEIVFRTTKLEGERATRRMVSSLFTAR